MKLAITANDRTYSIQIPWWFLLAALLSAVLWQPAAAWASTTFADVPSSHTFHDDIEWMAATGVTKGCNPPANSEYCPDDNVTRGQMAAFMHRFADEEVAPLEAEIATLEGELDALQSLLAGVTRSRTGNRIVFAGMDLQVVNGTGTTAGTPNGLGNLIIGYDTARPSGSDKTGSHYLVVGDRHNYTAFGGIVAGFNNTASGARASVFGGDSNTASGNGATITGGYAHTVSGAAASVSGGFGHTVSGLAASVSGGRKNTASGSHSSILGGKTETVGANDVCHPNCV